MPFEHSGLFFVLDAHPEGSTRFTFYLSNASTRHKISLPTTHVQRNSTPFHDFLKLALLDQETVERFAIM